MKIALVEIRTHDNKTWGARVWCRIELTQAMQTVDVSYVFIPTHLPSSLRFRLFFSIDLYRLNTRAIARTVWENVNSPAGPDGQSLGDFHALSCIWNFVSWEPKGRYCNSKMFRLRTRRATITVQSLNGNNALLALNWRLSFLCIKMIQNGIIAKKHSRSNF